MWTKKYVWFESDIEQIEFSDIFRNKFNQMWPKLCQMINSFHYRIKEKVVATALSYNCLLN